MNTKPKNKVKSLFSSFFFLLVSVGSISLTGFIFMSSAELIFNKDYPYIESIKASVLSEEIQYKIQQSLYKEYSYSFETLFASRELRYLDIPVLNQKLELSKAINQDDKWMYKGNKANYLVVKNTKGFDNIVIYFPQAWRTLLNTSTLKVGDFIFLHTNDEWDYIFRIESTDTYSLNEKFPLKSYDAMNITILIENSTSNTYQLIDAKVVSSRGSQI